jgi:hypothetical protein
MDVLGPPEAPPHRSTGLLGFSQLIPFSIGRRSPGPWPDAAQIHSLDRRPARSSVPPLPADGRSCGASSVSGAGEPQHDSFEHLPVSHQGHPVAGRQGPSARLRPSRCKPHRCNGPRGGVSWMEFGAPVVGV